MALQHYAEMHTRLASRWRNRGAREQHLRKFLEQGFPGKREEDWKYTDLSALAESCYEPAPAAEAAPDLSARFLADTDRLVFINGAYDATQSRSENTHAQAHGGELELNEEPAGPVVSLNAAFASDGLKLELPRGVTLARPLHVITWSGTGPADTMTHLRHRIALGENAEAVVVLHHLGASGNSYFTTQVTEVTLGRNARLHLYRLQEEGDGTHLNRIDVRQSRDSRLHCVTVDLGGKLVRNDLNIALAEEGAETQLLGLYAPAAKTHVDNHTRIDHSAPRCTSREQYKGVVAGTARAVFNGKIIVHEDAQKTDSEQHVANLLLAPLAEVDAKPELEIYADDVKCAHGATVGRLDEDAIYYLRSRGLDHEMARTLLTYTFAHEVLGRIGFDPLRRLAERRLLERLPGGAALEELL